MTFKRIIRGYSSIVRSQRYTIECIQKMKLNGKKIPMITCYDYTSSLMINKTKIPMILVGDSIGNNIFGYENTISVTLEDMIKASRSVIKGNDKALIITDMPFLTYCLDINFTIENVRRLIQETNIQGIKIEGTNNNELIKRLVDFGVPVMGHMGYIPQSINMIGKYKRLGCDKLLYDKMMEEAIELEKSGIFSLVLELVDPKLARDITKVVKIPTIGIGSGDECDGHIQVIHDLLGLNMEFRPKHSGDYGMFGESMKKNIDMYCEDVIQNKFKTIMY